MSHAKTKHGHSCCDLDASDPPVLVARCGGPAICRQCAIDAASAHSTPSIKAWVRSDLPGWPSTIVLARKIYQDAVKRLVEIGDAHGCEASSAAAFEHGRLAVLEELGLLGEDSTMASDETIRARRLELDQALRKRGNPPPSRDPIAFEPIVRRDQLRSSVMTEPESTNEDTTEAAAGDDETSTDEASTDDD